MEQLINLHDLVFDALEDGHPIPEIMEEVQNAIDNYKELQAKITKDKMLMEAEANFREAAATYMELLAGEPAPEGFLDGFIQIIKEGLDPERHKVVPTVKIVARDENNEEVDDELVEQVVDMIMKGLGK